MKIINLLQHGIGLIKSGEDPSRSDESIRSLVDSGFSVLVTIGDYDFNISWKIGFSVTIRRYQCTFGSYPEASKWELQHLNEFFLYELAHGRNVAIWCGGASVEKNILNSLDSFFKLDGNTLSEFIREKLDSQSNRAKKIPKELTHCKACKEKKCIIEMMCHVSSDQDAEEILRKGAILSAIKARQRTGEELAQEDRNAAGDPPDYFEYVMFTFGNCIAGDNLVMERSLGRSATSKELKYNFNPGVRFYCNYLDLVDHPGFRSDGYHYCKIKDSIDINNYLVVAIAPESTKAALSKAISSSLKNRLIFINQSEYSNLYSWSQEAYRTAIEYKGK